MGIKQLRLIRFYGAATISSHKLEIEFLDTYMIPSSLEKARRTPVGLPVNRFEHVASLAITKNIDPLMMLQKLTPLSPVKQMKPHSTLKSIPGSIVIMLNNDRTPTIDHV